MSSKGRLLGGTRQVMAQLANIISARIMNAPVSVSNVSK